MDIPGQILQFLFPEPCCHCGQGPALCGWLLCGDCRPSLRLRPRELDGGGMVRQAWFLAPYNGPVGSLVRRTKYRPDPAMMARLAGLLAGSLPALPPVCAVVHVPTSARRRMRRGFDQAAVLAEAAARRMDRPHRFLLRRHDPGEQAGRSPAARKAGLSFRFSARGQVPREILLVDDVRTTGSTLDACAMALLGAGCRSVYAVVLASAG